MKHLPSILPDVHSYPGPPACQPSAIHPSILPSALGLSFDLSFLPSSICSSLSIHPTVHISVCMSVTHPPVDPAFYLAFRPSILSPDHSAPHLPTHTYMVRLSVCLSTYPWFVYLATHSPSHPLIHPPPQPPTYPPTHPSINPSTPLISFSGYISANPGSRLPCVPFNPMAG